MRNNSKKQLKIQDTILQIRFISDISDELGNTVPYPYHYQRTHQGHYLYSWLLDGYFETVKSITFLNDIIARFKITFEDCHLNQTRVIERSSTQALKLKHFQNLKSRVVSVLNERTQYDAREDFVFWCLKFYAEDIIREHKIVTYDELLVYAYDNFINTKAGQKRSLKSKCRSIVNYYIANDFKLSTRGKYTRKDKEQVMATRIEHALNLGRDKENKSKAMIQNAISGIFADEMFKRKNGTYNAKAIADYLHIDPRTVRKHLKELLN